MEFLFTLYEKLTPPRLLSITENKQRKKGENKLTDVNDARLPKPEVNRPQA